MSKRPLNPRVVELKRTLTNMNGCLDKAAATAKKFSEQTGSLAEVRLKDVPQVIAHGCDRFDRAKLCPRCHGKWKEIDRRMPVRTP